MKPIEQKNIALIPARSGSIGIPDKNIREFDGKPLIAWTIELAVQCPVIDQVIVSTDCDLIADIAISAGAEIPFKRPAALAGPDVGIEPVVEHCVTSLRSRDPTPIDTVSLLFPTNPLRQVSHVIDCHELLVNSQFDCVFTIIEVPAHYSPFWCLSRGPDGSVTNFDGTELANAPKRRQDFPKSAFAKNDVCFVFYANNVLSGSRSIFGEKPGSVTISRYFDADINDLADWEIALERFKSMKT